MGKRLADRLDWNQMMGFEQVSDMRGDLRASASKRLGAKVGSKPKFKPVDHMGTIGTKIGQKIGLKSAD